MGTATQRGVLVADGEAWASSSDRCHTADRPYTYFVEIRVRKRRRGFTRVTSKYQATIPRAAAEAAGIQPGDELHVEVAGEGRLIVTREDDPVRALAALGERLGVHYPDGYLEALRAEWE
jgi:AbrB family looped-hinge helix DNA binding protein